MIFIFVTLTLLPLTSLSKKRELYWLCIKAAIRLHLSEKNTLNFTGFKVVIAFYLSEVA